jgi:hypothetical protein
MDRRDFMTKFELILAFLSPLASFAAPALNPSPRTPVLLELFTSEGCSSCPPADRLLEELDRTQPLPGVELIVLSEHVDYWNRLGWKDPFSSALYSARQGEYSNRFHLDSVYTPQLVVDGKFQLVGHDRREAFSAIGHSMHDLKLPIVISEAARARSSVTATFEVPGSERSNGTTLIYVVLADNQTHSSVVSGENSGRALTHVAVARHIIQSGPARLSTGLTKQVALPVPPGAGAEGLRVVVFLQDQSSGHVLGAAVRKVKELP